MRYPILLLALLLLPGIAPGADPVWTATGGSPVDISSDGASVLTDGEIFGLYDAGGSSVWRGYGGSYAESRGEVYSPLAITADGMYSVLGASQGLLYVDRKQQIFWQDTELHPIDDLSLSPDENFVASVAQGIISVYSRGGDILWRNDTYPDVRYVAISPRGILTVAGGKDTIHAFNQTGFELWNYTSPGIHGVRLSLDSNIIAASEYTLLCLHPSGNLLWKFYTGDQIRDFAISRDGSSVAAGNQAGRLVLLDRNGKEVFSAQLGNWVNAVSVSGDGALIAAGNTDRKVYLFDRSGQQLFSYTTGSIVKDAAISSDGSALAATADMVYYFDLASTSPAEITPTGQPPVTPPPATTALPPAPATTPASAPVTEAIPEGLPPTEAPPEEPPTTEAGSVSLAVLALGIGAVWFVKRR
jgi:WD40 repeat protein